MADQNGDRTLDSEAARLDSNPLSEREREVARRLATGASNAEIARDLIISPHTVKVHLRNIFEKLQVSSRTEATMVLVQRGWIEVPGAVREPVAETLPPPPPEPEPLANLPPRVRPWQRVYLVAALLLTLLALAVPTWRSQARTSAPLLSDSGVGAGIVPPLVLDARWGALTPLPTARSRHAVAHIGTNLYILGGETTGGRLLRSMDRYDLTVNRWSALAPLPEAVSNLAVARIGEFLYVAGGTRAADPENASPEAEPSASLNGALWRYSTVDDRWEVLGDLPVPVAGAALAADETTLYLVGGWDGQAMRDELWALTVGSGAETQEADAQEWRLLDRMETARSFLGAVVVNGAIFVVGGFDGQRELARADAYSLADARWQALPPMAEPRSGLALVYDGVALVALGGGWLDTVNTHERYDPLVEVWSNFPSPLAGSWRHLGAASQDGRLYLLGGWSGDYLDAHVQYQSTFRALLPVITNE